ncbi:MAG TPA: DUF1302 family protein [Burkholderiales bacterium]|nr:DUF1302 family protein [Burkholderiales bacterium]
MYLDRVRRQFPAVVLALTAGARAEEPAGSSPTLSTEISAGGIARVGERDPGLVGISNGGTGRSINYDDGNLNYGRGLASLAVQGRSILAANSEHVDLAVEAVYFYDFLNANGNTEFHDLTEESRSRAGRGIYLNDAYLGLQDARNDERIAIRAGNQRLRWSDSPSFGQSIAPVNPVAASRRYMPGNTAKDLVVALPMIFAEAATRSHWSASAFYLLGFEPSEPEAAGTFLNSNDYYSPGSRYLQLSALVPDTDASVTTPATPFGSRVTRGPDRMPASGGQFGVRLETPEMGHASVVLSAYGMRVHAREPLVSVHTGTLGGLLGATAADYASSGNYFLEYPKGVTVFGGALRLEPAAHTRLNADFSMRIRQPLQIDDQLLTTAGLAPAAATVACAPNPASPPCVGTLAALNGNPVIAGLGGISAANAGTWFDRDLQGFERFDVSQWALGVTQGLPSVAGAARWYATAEAGGVYVHGFRSDFLDASVTVRPDENGDTRNGFATRSAWGYRLYSRIDFPGVAGLKTVSPSVAWMHDVHGNAPITLGTLLQGTKSCIAAVDAALDEKLSARVSYRAWFGRGNDADRYTDRDFVAFSLTRKF